MHLTYDPIGIEQQPAYLKRLLLCPEITSDYSFVNLWAWAEEYGLNWAWTDELVWIKQTRPEEAFWAPVGPWKDLDWAMLCKRYLSGPTDFIRFPEKLMTIWKEHIPEHMVVREARGHWDYLYDIQELITLGGNRFHKKKNLLKQFKNKYPHRFVPLNGELIALVNDMQESWCVWRDCEAVDTLSQENRAIQKVLQKWDQLERVSGGVILVDERIAAYTIAEQVNEETVVIHFEKGDPDFKGVYQAINQMFLEYLHANPLHQKITLVNREQDLDNEGLRKAKLSYHPVSFLKKYRVHVKKSQRT